MYSLLGLMRLKSILKEIVVFQKRVVSFLNFIDEKEYAIPLFVNEKFYLLPYYVMKLCVN